VTKKEWIRGEIAAWKAEGVITDIEIGGKSILKLAK